MDLSVGTDFDNLAVTDVLGYMSSLKSQAGFEILNPCFNQNTFFCLSLGKCHILKSIYMHRQACRPSFVIPMEAEN